ncbi:hypothetical protein [uncultured Megasphaera sp.]|uniref:hypothetical protein n=1 Tax=Megasphaera massiliensis TaxID=1232428 RepID=UPI00266C9FD9|nr:hypothetical protein [uncultured Megasphaera sp.]
MQYILALIVSAFCFYGGWLFFVDKRQPTYKPLSKGEFKKACIIIFLLTAVFSYSYKELKLENDSYGDYKIINEYIHSLSDDKKRRFQNALISQKANLDKKYGIKNNYDKSYAAEKITDENDNRFGVEANPLLVEEYFDDDSYYYLDNIYYINGIIYAVAMYALYRRRVKKPTQ